MTRYEHTMRVIQQYIAEHQLGPGDRLPAETELAQLAGVSLITVRRAMAEMANRGLVRREQGRGSYVEATLIDAETTRLGSLRETLGGHHALTTEVLGVVERAATEREQAALRLSRLGRVWEVTRRRLIDGEPAIVEVATVPTLRAPALDAALEADPNVSLYRLLAERYGLEEGHEEQTLVVRLPDPTTRERLGLSPGDLAVVVTGVSYALDGQPFDAFRMAYDARRFAFHLRSTPQAALVAVTRDAPAADRSKTG
jgi:DNA-binding GntR family transcriptional regulator